ncbi:MAG: histidinol-phosphate transaminase [Chloroflexi bacterium]|nr:histidinol-phosphate transaminase [Chloroflexota bacterium]
MAVRPRPELEGLRPAVHGAIGDQELVEYGLRWDDVLDFSVNSNPYGPPPGVTEAIAAADVTRYPEPDARPLLEALAAHAGVSPEQVVCGNGSVELMWLAALAYLRPGDAAVIVGPSFGEYETVCRIAGARLHQITAEPGAAWPPTELIERATALRPRLLFLCNPNNPTGAYLPPNEIAPLLDGLPDTLFVLDEAYLAFVEGGASASSLLGRGNLLILRSMTKDYALAGLRLGYGMAAPEIAAALHLVRPPWNVNAAAQAAGLAAIASIGYLERTAALVLRATVELMAELQALGLRTVPTRANFFLVEVGNAAAVRRALLRHGCCVRDCASFGLPCYVRIGVRTPEENRRLVAAWRDEMAEGNAASG